MRKVNRHGEPRKTWDVIFTPPTLFADRFFQRARILIDLRARTIIRGQRKEFVCAKRSEPPLRPRACKRHRHSNIFSLACVLIRTLINACHDTPHLSHMPSSSLSLSLILYLSFAPSHVRFTCSHQAIRIYIYIVTVCDTHCYSKTIGSLLWSRRIISLRLPSFTFL